MQTGKYVTFVTGSLLGLGIGVTATLVAQPQDDTAVQVNLTQEGSISQRGVRGRDDSGPLQQHMHSKPKSAGDEVAVIRIYEHDGSPEDLQTTGGASAHAHAGKVDPPYDTHCHQWVKIGPTWYLVHC
jgi:hypothetical protein